ncbi:MAG: DEAD/DEAH box helicase [Acidobacteria bacterium]|nr:DEAD/DEAH box helicase [Acidobacteriota bacterium]
MSPAVTPGSPFDPRRALRRTWGVFFQRFGRLLPIQAEAVPVLLAGRDALLSAPTATGKTEAAVAPLLERLLASGSPPGGLLYVAPTRALVNDLDRRLAGPCRDLGLQLAVRTGDRKELKTARPPHVLLTTPESLDSLLCRAPAVFCQTRALVLDEIHQVDANYRGDQLRVLVRRLEAAAGRRPQSAALSATLADAEATAARYLSDPAVCRAGSGRGLELRLAGSLAEAVGILRETKRLKAVLFCNRRADVEAVATRLPAERLWPADAVFAHHGSLPRPFRERTEAALRQREWGICAATMTLELGMDIGDVSAVVLLGPPPTAASFQQRIGRACRREGTIFVVGIAETEWERELFEAYAALAREGQVERTGYAPDPSVIVQQAFSILYAHPGGVPPADLAGLLSPLGRPPLLREVLDHLEAEGWLRRTPRSVRAETSLMDLGERGRVHSNIPDAGEFEVVDAGTGEVVCRAFLQVAVGSVVALAGRVWEVTGIGRKAVMVRRCPEGAPETRFGARPQQGAFYRYLPEKLRTPGVR